MHIPLIIAGPGVPKGETRDALVYLLDVFPTLGDLCGVKGPDGSEGQSLAGVLAGKETGVRDSLFTAYTKVQRAVREDRWKLIGYPQINKTQFFDLKDDPAETKDLSGEPAHAADVARLAALLKDWQKKLDDKQPLKTDKPEPVEFDFSKVPPEKPAGK
jgi:arylsulfatase A-like enzyme